ncbi:unnamed protein product, partial [marine sediment metagenome]
ELKVKLPDQFKVWVVNQQKSPDKIKVSNLSEIKFPKEIEVKKPAWYDIRGIESALTLLLKEITLLPKKVLRTKIIDSSDPQRPVAVRLSNGRRFYNAIARGVGMAKQAFPFKTSTGKYQEGLVDETGRQLVLRYGFDGTTWRPTLVDELSGGDVCISHEEHAVHEEDGFYAQIIDTTLASGATLIMLVTVPDSTPQVHAKFGFNTAKEATLMIYENPDISSVGGAVTEWNRDRNSAVAATVVVTEKPAITANGTLMQSRLVGSGGKVGGEMRNEVEWLLKTDEQYLIILTS